MEGFLYLIAVCFGGEFPLNKSRIHTAYIGEDSSIFKVLEMFGDLGYESSKSMIISYRCRNYMDVQE